MGVQRCALRTTGSPRGLELNCLPRATRFTTPYRRGEELDHLAFRVTDVDRAFHELTAKGARAEVEPFRESRYAFAFVSDPDGIWIELLGRVPVNPEQVVSKEGRKDR